MTAPEVLVTGSAGHLGHGLMLELSSYGFCPVGIDVLKSEFTSHLGSVSDRAFVQSILNQYPSLRYILHTATLHKPHVDSHTKENFVETNIKGTLVLLEEAARRKDQIEAFVFTSTTSTFGDALAPKPGQPAAWINETVTPLPKNIYGATKVAAEDICLLVHNESRMPVIVLKTSRFFPEPDDNEKSRLDYSDDNLKVLELLYRRVDIADVVAAHVCAMEAAKKIAWGKYIISAPSPFQNDKSTLEGLDGRASQVLRAVRPEHAERLLACGLKLPGRIDRVYDSSKAIQELNWAPQFSFERAVESISRGEDWKSHLAIKVGKRGYHSKPTGVYTA